MVALPVHLPKEMVDAPTDPPGSLDEELEEYAEDLGDVDDDVRELIAALTEETDASLRLGVRYSGDDEDVVYLREDIRAQYTDPELEARVDALVVKGLGDPPREESLYDFGRLDATFRWYDEVLVTHFPYREWSGLVFTFDRYESTLVDLAQEYLED